MDPLAIALLEREGDVRDVLAQALGARGRSRTELTFNITNVLIDFDGGTATVDDELDVEVSVVVPSRGVPGVHRVVPLATLGNRPYPRVVSKQPKAKTFAEVVREVEQQPVVPEADYSGVVDPSGKRWHQQLAEISPARALELARAGASVAWDRCGCGGYCGFDWYGAEEVARMVESGTPKVRCTKRRKGNISEWANTDGGVLIVAEDAVQWGGLIDG